MKKSTFKTYFCILVLLLLPQFLAAGGEYASTPEIEVYDLLQMKAGFIFRVSHLAIWPDKTNIAKKKEPFVIGIIGDKELTGTLVKTIGKKKIMGKKVKVIPIPEEELTNLDRCNVLFIGKFSRRKLKRIIEAVENYPILTIGNTKGYEKKGVMINLKDPYASRISFAVNCLTAKRNGITLTSKIVRYASTIIK